MGKLDSGPHDPQQAGPFNDQVGIAVTIYITEAHNLCLDTFPPDLRGDGGCREAAFAIGKIAVEPMDLFVLGRFYGRQHQVVGGKTLFITLDEIEGGLKIQPAPTEAVIRPGRPQITGRV